MSSIEDTRSIGDDNIDGAGTTRENGYLNRMDAILSALGERLNPILIKETRQALKSRQFMLTFAALLIAGWGWSIFGTVMQMPSIYYSPMGDVMLAGYYCILAVPILIIVPFSAFRSLAAERDDGTYELLSITSLSSRQVVTGKLSSAVLQMVIYYSALAPCIVFTYLLRGVNIVAILVLLFFTFLISILFSALGLMFAGLSGPRNFQMLLTVVLLIGLFCATFGWLAIFVEGIEEVGLDVMIAYEETAFWIGSLAFLNLYISYFVIVILVAAAQNSFASDNRSTKIRVAMFAQTICYIGWFTAVWISAAQWEVLAIGLMLAAAHWYVYACFLTGESGQLSPRVKRSLPQSFAGRVFLTWFNPGSGTGYLFATVQIGVLCLYASAGFAIQELFGVPESSWTNAPRPPSHAYLVPIMVFEYSVLYLGIGRLLILLIPQRERFSFILPFLVHFVVVVTACLIPIAIQNLSTRYFAYTPIQFPNWAWTLVQLVDGRMRYGELPIVIGTAAILVFLVNLVLAAREIETVRLETPTRVKEEIDKLKLKTIG